MIDVIRGATIRIVTLASAVGIITCARDHGAGAAASDRAPSAAAAEPGAAGSAVHEVKMLETPAGDFVFEPAALTIRVGDVVRWVNVSGGMHNVAFYADRIPEGAAPLLDAAMPGRLTDLTGPLVEAPGQTYEVAFDDLPPGHYAYYCTPHEMLGMRAQLTVTRE
jgi:plastocyanin